MILLDTHVWIRWQCTGSHALPTSLVSRIESTTEPLAISAISCWELGQLVRRGRVQLTLPVDQWIDYALADAGIECLTVDRRIASLAAALPEHHRDPADRLIIATALVHDCALASLDGAFDSYVELSNRLVR